MGLVDKCVNQVCMHRYICKYRYVCKYRHVRMGKYNTNTGKGNVT